MLTWSQSTRQAQPCPLCPNLPDLPHLANSFLLRTRKAHLCTYTQVQSGRREILHRQSKRSVPGRPVCEVFRAWRMDPGLVGAFLGYLLLGGRGGAVETGELGGGALGMETADGQWGGRKNDGDEGRRKARWVE